MKSTLIATIRQGRVILLSGVRRRLKVKPRDWVGFEITDDETNCVVPAPFMLEQVFGSVKPRNKPEDFKKLSKQARGNRYQNCKG